MSGGSLDYLYLATDDIESLARRKWAIEEAAEKLCQMAPESKAAKDTLTVLDFLKQAQGAGRDLANVWHAVEWWLSNDYGEDQVREAIAKYEEGLKG